MIRMYTDTDRITEFIPGPPIYMYIAYYIYMHIHVGCVVLLCCLYGSFFLPSSHLISIISMYIHSVGVCNTYIYMYIPHSLPVTM